MKQHEVNAFIALIESYYPTTFASPPCQQLWLWYHDLAPYSMDNGLEALTRWVRWHREQTPQLGDILDGCKAVKHEAARWLSTAEAAPVERPPDQSILLRHMARLNQYMLAPWEDAAGQLHDRLTLRKAAMMCRRWSARYRDRPALAQDFAVMARQYDIMDDEGAAKLA